MEVDVLDHYHIRYSKRFDKGRACDLSGSRGLYSAVAVRATRCPHGGGP